jgi:branched-chain amino acid transport system permease protein
MSGVLSYLVFFLTTAAIYSIASLGLNLQWGRTGLFNIGVSGFFAVGAYAYAILTISPLTGQPGLGWPVLAGLLGAMVAAGLFALLVGIPTLRLRDDYLAIATIGIAITVQLIATNEPELTGGTNGLFAIPQPVAGWLHGSGGVAFLILVLICVALVYLALERMIHSPWGRVLVAIREDETAASSLGKSAFSFRLQSLVIGSMAMGLSGALYAAFIKFISPQDFLPIFTFQVWAMLILGGSGSSAGALLGSLVVWAIWTLSGGLIQAALPAKLQVDSGAIQIILIGLLLMLVILFRPSGLLGRKRPAVHRSTVPSKEQA